VNFLRRLEVHQMITSVIAQTLLPLSVQISLGL
jgi:hypothetical protein